MTEVFVVSTSAEDDAALVALDDVSHLLTAEDEGCIVGGHMVSLLSSRYPSAGFQTRHTGDADAGIPVHVAQSGTLHDGLLSLGYRDQSGNRYVLPGAGPRPTIDLLTPAATEAFEPDELGGRAFDSMPGLRLALASPLTFDVVATLADGAARQFPTRVPTVEAAVVLKANAWGARLQLRDAIDLHNLFCIVRGGHGIGSWRLDGAELTGARLDAARLLHRLADTWEARPPAVRFDARLLVATIRRTVTRPRA